MRIRFLTVALASAFLAGCGGDSTGVGNGNGGNHGNQQPRLTEAQAAALARALVAPGLGVARDGAADAQRRSASASADGGVSADFTGTVAVSFTAPCQPSGAVGVAGSLTATWLAASQSATLQSVVTLTPQSCAVQTNEGVVTLTGAPNVVLTLAAAGTSAGLTSLRITETGTVDWSRGGGNDGRCVLGLTADLLPGTRNVRVHGTFCGIPVDHTGPA